MSSVNNPTRLHGSLNFRTLLSQHFSCICKKRLHSYGAEAGSDNTVLPPACSPSRFCLQRTWLCFNVLLKNHISREAVLELEGGLYHSLLLICALFLAPSAHCCHLLGDYFKILSALLIGLKSLFLA